MQEEEQKLADLPRERIMCKPFTNIQVDLVGDIKVKAMCNSRATLKTYPVIFVCMNTGAMNLRLMHAYDTAAFLLQYEHNCAV